MAIFTCDLLNIHCNGFHFLFISDAPSFIISRIPGFGYPIREGIAMALKCDVDANPMSRPLWLKGKPNCLFIFNFNLYNFLHPSTWNSFPFHNLLHSSSS